MSIHRPPITHTFHQKVFVSIYFFLRNEPFVEK